MLGPELFRFPNHVIFDVMLEQIEKPDSPAMQPLCDALAQAAPRLEELSFMSEASGSGGEAVMPPWPREQLELCAQAGVFRWFLAPEFGGFGWNEAEQTQGYRRLAAACLTTTFILTQRSGACRRIAASNNHALRERYLADLASGSIFATVGISHLTTSRQHTGKPALLATPIDGGYRLDGISPWVTGAAHSDVMVIGASLEDGRQILAAVPNNYDGIKAQPGQSLVALSASCTDQVIFENVRIENADLIDGPIENVMQRGAGAGTGGLQTSTLALGLAAAAIQYLTTQAADREDLRSSAAALQSQLDQLDSELLATLAGRPSCSSQSLRQHANSLVLRSTQAALTAAKGAGYLRQHPAGRWCREALFFLVWSCPQVVANAQMCELAGLGAAELD